MLQMHDAHQWVEAAKTPSPAFSISQISSQKREPTESTDSKITCTDDSFTWWCHNYDCWVTTVGLISYYMVLCCETEFNTEETHTFFDKCQRSQDWHPVPITFSVFCDNPPMIPAEVTSGYISFNFAVNMLACLRLCWCCSSKTGQWIM